MLLSINRPVTTYVSKQKKRLNLSKTKIKEL